MQVVSIYKKLKISLFVGLSLMIISCSNKLTNFYSTYNKGGYKWVWYESNDIKLKDSIWFTIKIKDIDSKKEDKLMPSTITFNCSKHNTKEKSFSFKVKANDIKNQLKITSIGYLSIETKPFEAHPRDSIIIDFFLAEDDRPLVNCEE